MRLYLIFAVASVFVAAQASGQISRDVRALSLAGSEVADSHSSGETNPAFFAADSALSVWTRFTPTANYIDGAFEAAGGLSAPVGDLLQIGCAFDHLGYQSIYAFNEASLNLSTKVGKERYGLAGVRIRYAHESYGDRIAPMNSVSVDVGVRAEPVQDLSLGADVLDVVAPANQSATFDVGLGYRIEESLLLASARLADDRVGFAFGAEVPIAPSLVMRAGTSTLTHLFTGGVTFRFSDLDVDLGFAQHPDLGTALSFGLRWESL